MKRKWVTVIAAMGILAVMIIIGISIFYDKNGEIPVPSESLSVAFVTGSESIGDKGINDELWIGLQECKEEYGIRLRLYGVSGDKGAVDKYHMAASEGADLIIVRSAQAKSAMSSMKYIKEEFPKVKLAIIDDREAEKQLISALENGKETIPLNAQLIGYREEETAFIGSYIAGLEAKTGNFAVCVQDNASQEKTEIGFEAGIKTVEKEIKKAVHGKLEFVHKNADLNVLMQELRHKAVNVAVITFPCDEKKAVEIGKTMGIKVITYPKISYSGISTWATKTMAPTMFRPGIFRLGYEQGAIQVDLDKVQVGKDNFKRVESLLEKMEEGEITVPYTKFMYEKYINELIRGKSN